jgi:putative endonuclease
MAAAKSTENPLPSNSSTRQTGKRGEDCAVRFLKKAGYRIIERNYRCAFGEMDIVALDSGTISFIEVKSRTSNRFGNPEEAVVTKKQKKLSQIALHYLKAKNLDEHRARFDVVAINFSSEDEGVTLIKDAFDLIL